MFRQRGESTLGWFSVPKLSCSKRYMCVLLISIGKTQRFECSRKCSFKKKLLFDCSQALRIFQDEVSFVLWSAAVESLKCNLWPNLLFPQRSFEGFNKILNFMTDREIQDKLEMPKSWVRRKDVLWLAFLKLLQLNPTKKKRMKE